MQWLTLFHLFSSIFILNTVNLKFRFHGKVVGPEGKITVQGHGCKCINCSVSLLQNLWRMASIIITGASILPCCSAQLLVKSLHGEVDISAEGSQQHGHNLTGKESCGFPEKKYEHVTKEVQCLHMYIMKN